VNAEARPAWLRQAELAGLAALAIGAVVAWLAFAVLPTFDSLYALVWGREILDGVAPGFADFGAPTQHPLWLGIATVLAPFGDAGARTLTLIGVGSYAALVAATYHLGRTAFGPLAGAIAAGLLLTRLNLGFYAAFAFVDVPFAALIMVAAALEAARPRRGGVVWVLLVLAGLLRPEGWIFAAAYGLWLARRADARGRIRIAALVVLAPLLWALSDLAITGDPLFSWTYTTGEASRLGRQRGVLDTPAAVWTALSSLIKAPVVLAGSVGVVLALVAGARRRAAIPLALLVLGLAAFAIDVLAGASGQVPRYALLAAVALVLFAGYLVACLLSRARDGVAGRLALPAGVALLVAGAAWTATHLHPRSVTRLLDFRESVEHDLAAALRSPAVRTARRCGPIAVPTFKLVPNVRWELDVAAGEVFARNDPASARAQRPGVVLLERTKRLLHDPGYGAFGQSAGGNSPPSAQQPPRGYERRGHTRYFEIYTRC
jgi:hypothetical protein